MYNMKVQAWVFHWDPPIFLCFIMKEIGFQPALMNLNHQYIEQNEDDCFALFNNKQEAEKFLKFLNVQHQNINFTIEHENNQKLPFLDILIERASNKFNTSIYSKPTFTGLGSSFFSYTPKVFKYSAIKTLIFRAFHICSNYCRFHYELEFLKNFLTKNGYPTSIFYKLVKDFLNKTFSKKTNCFEVSKLQLYFKFPLFGSQGDKMNTELINILTK